MEAFFNCKVASQYGCYEVNSIAYECPFHKLHVMTENVYVEIVGIIKSVLHQSITG